MERLATTYNARAFAFDFKNVTNWQEYEALCKEIKQVGDVSVLVNNVEMFDVGKGKVHKTSDEDLLACVNRNTYPVVFMSRFLGVDMRARG